MKRLNGLICGNLDSEISGCGKKKYSNHAEFQSANQTYELSVHGLVRKFKSRYN